MTREPPRLLTVTSADGTSETFALPGPGGVERIAVGRPGVRSGVWRVWASRRKSDVYIAARPLAGAHKFSLHESGDWRHQRVIPREQRPPEHAHRILDQWSPPAEVGAGFTKGLTVIVPHEDVTEVPGNTQDLDEVVWLPEPGPGYAWVIHVGLWRPDRGELQMPDAAPIAGFTLADGRAVLVIVARVWLDAEKLGRIDNNRTAATSRYGEHSREWATKGGSPRRAVYAYDEVEQRFVYDLSATPRSNA